MAQIKRKANFLPKEEIALKRAYLEKRDILESRLSASITRLDKDIAWSYITEEVNRENPLVLRTKLDCRKKLNNLRMLSKFDLIPCTEDEFHSVRSQDGISEVPSFVESSYTMTDRQEYPPQSSVTNSSQLPNLHSSSMLPLKGSPKCYHTSSNLNNSTEQEYFEEDIANLHAQVLILKKEKLQMEKEKLSLEIQKLKSSVVVNSTCNTCKNGIY